MTESGKSVPVNICLGSQQLAKLRELHLEGTELTQDEKNKLLKSFEKMPACRGSTKNALAGRGPCPTPGAFSAAWRVASSKRWSLATLAATSACWLPLAPQTR